MADDLPIFNFPAHAKIVTQLIKGLKGIYRIELKKVQDQRTLAQNAYLHGVVFLHLAKGLSDAWGYKVSMREAKAFAKDEFLRREIVNRETGEATGKFFTPSTADLDKGECAEFIDRIREFSLEYLNTVIPDAGEYETEAA